MFAFFSVVRFFSSNVSLNLMRQISVVSVDLCPLTSGICYAKLCVWDYAVIIGLPIKCTSSVTRVLAKYAWFDPLRDKVIDRGSPVIAW